MLLRWASGQHYFPAPSFCRLTKKLSLFAPVQRAERRLSGFLHHSNNNLDLIRNIDSPQALSKLLFSDLFEELISDYSSTSLRRRNLIVDPFDHWLHAELRNTTPTADFPLRFLFTFSLGAFQTYQRAFVTAETPLCLCPKVESNQVKLLFCKVSGEQYHNYNSSGNCSEEKRGWAQMQPGLPSISWHNPFQLEVIETIFLPLTSLLKTFLPQLHSHALCHGQVILVSLWNDGFVSTGGRIVIQRHTSHVWSQDFFCAWHLLFTLLFQGFTKTKPWFSTSYYRSNVYE